MRRFVAVLITVVGLAFSAPAVAGHHRGATARARARAAASAALASTPTTTTTATTRGKSSTAAPGTPSTSTPTETPPSGCYLSSVGLVCPGNPGCVVTSAGVTCASNCVVTSAGLFCPRGKPVPNPPVKPPPKRRVGGQKKHRRPPTPPPPVTRRVPVSTPPVAGGHAETVVLHELPFTGAPIQLALLLGCVLLLGGVALRRVGATTRLAFVPAEADLPEAPEATPACRSELHAAPRAATPACGPELHAAPRAVMAWALALLTCLAVVRSVRRGRS